ncbi:DUF1999 domain-containing protein [Deinococcus aquiradiocola]|uniref:GNAT family acetyltransferase n=1 Tax=Deinococcus aquiradiocola TaxID=393059 RepID=A0A917US37_9DEIO|nr:DUF1999 domain-containing protein [Deinococcus aquiradiocola]GGJ81090.1 GNAT family acetyltransferase [Deinococcus aquiradiocola]
MRYRVFTEDDFEAMSDLDRQVQAQDPAWPTLPEREQEGRLRTSLPALRFYLRSEHSFISEERVQGSEDSGQLTGLIFAQSVWMGDKPIILVTACLVRPGSEDEGRTAAGLLHAVIKSAYDAAVYEVHYPLTPLLHAAGEAEGSHVTGRYAVHHLGSRQDTAPGERLRGGGYTDAGRR